MNKGFRKYVLVAERPQEQKGPAKKKRCRRGKRGNETQRKKKKKKNQKPQATKPKTSQTTFRGTNSGLKTTRRRILEQWKKRGEIDFHKPKTQECKKHYP